MPTILRIGPGDAWLVTLRSVDGRMVPGCAVRVDAMSFYRSNQPAKKMTQDGTWMFIPHGHTERVSPLSKSARRRKRRVNAGDPSGSSVDGGEFDPEEESPHYRPSC